MFFRRQLAGSSPIGWHLCPSLALWSLPTIGILLILLRNSSFLGLAVSVGNSSAYS
jgi:hypothetical protein